MDTPPITPPGSPCQSMDTPSCVDVVYKLAHNGTVSDTSYIVKNDTPNESYDIRDSKTHESVGEIQYNPFLKCACTPPFVTVDKVTGIENGTVSLVTEYISAGGLKECVNGVMKENEQATILMQKIIDENRRLANENTKLENENTRLENELKTTKETRQKELNLAGFLYTTRKQKQENEKK